MAANVSIGESIVEDSVLSATTTKQTTCTDPLSHAELMEFFQESIKQLVKIDPIIKDLHPQVTLDEVEALIALEHGHAITIFVERESGSLWKVVVSKEATLHQLKLALKHHVTLSLKRQNNFKKISWKYIWRMYWLCFEETKLTDDNKKLLSYGITNKAKLTFLKKIKRKKEN